jgi:NAD(P)-dependent dehydrogenase (short-subunit alcohol dehydrogenase family)
MTEHQAATRTAEKISTEKPQQQPGLESKMEIQPLYDAPWYKGSGKLKNKVALITGGDSGIGRSIAILFAREGCDVAINYLPKEQRDAETTKQSVEKEGRQCILLPGDLRDARFCNQLIDKTVESLGGLHVLVCNAGEQFYHKSITEISDEELDDIFKVNFYHIFRLCRAGLRHIPKGGSIICSSSITAYKGKPELLDYSSTKGAIQGFIRSLSQQVGGQGIRVNAVAPGPVWTPLIPATFPKEAIESFGKETTIGRAAMPEEIAPCYVFLASQDASFITGQTLHPNGGTVLGV